MKVQNLNSSSKKTKKIIKSVFAEMLSEKRELSKISVSELCSRAEISRGAFYSHYDDIYGVAEDYENELIDMFFDNARLLSPSTVEQFVDSLFDYIRKNDENYKLLCCSNDFQKTGIPSVMRARSASNRSRSCSRRRMTVLSPPGMMRRSSGFSRSRACRISKCGSPRRSSMAACSANAP